MVVRESLEVLAGCRLSFDAIDSDGIESLYGPSWTRASRAPSGCGLLIGAGPLERRFV